MSNFLLAAKVETLRSAFNAGASIRVAAKRASVSKITAMEYFQSWGQRPFCACGQRADHRGWCAERYKKSPARQAALAHASTHRRRPPDPELRPARRCIDCGKKYWQNNWTPQFGYNRKVCWRCANTWSDGHRTFTNLMQAFVRRQQNMVAVEELAPLHQERTEWREARRILKQLRVTLQQWSHSPGAASAPGGTSSV